MNAIDINRFPIREYLAGINIHPAKDRGYYGMYYSPFREDHNASFKVDYNKNLWHDFGLNEGGTLIDLVMRIENCSNGEAMRLLEQRISGNSFSFQGNNLNSNKENKQGKQSSGIRITEVTELYSSSLLDYLGKRGIDVNTAKQFCQEVHYVVNGRDYYGIGSHNDTGGYELSSPLNFKGCISPKDITTIRNNSDTCLVFEGFWDFLSYLAIQKIEKTKHDVAILNSVANVQKAMDFLKLHREIYTYLDNDEAGRKATELIKSNCVSVNNRSERYAGFKDLNDFLCGKKHPQVAEQNKISKPIPQSPKKKNRGLKM